MVVAKGRDAVARRELRLREANLGSAKIAEPEISRDVRLVVTAKEWTRLADVGPLCETPPPPRVVFRNRVELRQVERDGAGSGRGAQLRIPRSFIVALTTSWQPNNCGQSLMPARIIDARRFRDMRRHGRRSE